MHRLAERGERELNSFASSTSSPPDAAQALGYTNHPSEPGLSAEEMSSALSKIPGVPGWATPVGRKPAVGYQPPRHHLHCPKPLSFQGALRLKWQVVPFFFFLFPPLRSCWLFCQKYQNYASGDFLFLALGLLLFLGEWNASGVCWIFLSAW